MKLNDAVMKETFSKIDEENDPILYRVYGVVTATVGKMLLLGNLSALANQCHVYSPAKIIKHYTMGLFLFNFL